MRSALMSLIVFFATTNLAFANSASQSQQQTKTKAAAQAGAKSSSSSHSASSSNSASSAQNHTNVGVKASQQQSQQMNNSGNSSANLENVGNAQSESASESSAVNGDVQSTISIVGDTNVYKAPIIPVNAAPPSFATLCTGAMAGTTMRVAFSQSSVTLVCDLQNASTATFTQSMRNWWMIDNRYVPQMEDLDLLIFETEQQIKEMYQRLKELEDEMQQGQRKGTISYSKYDRVEEIRKLKEKIAATETLLKKYKASFAKVEERIIALTFQAERFMDYSNEEMHIMHVVVTSRSHRVASRLATFAQNIFAPLGFIAIAKEVF